MIDVLLTTVTCGKVVRDTLVRSLTRRVSPVSSNAASYFFLRIEGRSCILHMDIMYGIEQQNDVCPSFPTLPFIDSWQRSIRIRHWLGRPHKSSNSRKVFTANFHLGQLSRPDRRKTFEGLDLIRGLL